MQMNDEVSLWTQDELAQAFALLMPASEARAMAARWWAIFADKVDEAGRYLHDGPWNEPQPSEAGDEFGGALEWQTVEQVEADGALFTGLTDASLEHLLLRLGDLHFALVALVSPELFVRMRAVREISLAGAQRSRSQLTAAVRTYRRLRGLPPPI